MLNSKYLNSLPNFTPHGVKTIGNYSYILLIDSTGQTLIQQISSDQSTIMFHKMPTPASENHNDIAAAITAFWADPTVGPFVYQFQL